MNRIDAIRTATAALVAAALLAACGGSDNHAPPPDDGLTQQQREDRAASASVAQLFAFAVALVSGRTSEVAEPRAIDGITPPVAEDAEPAALTM